jgi:two-component system KDP operon response regulator KdpE
MTVSAKILIVDDEPEIRQFLDVELTHQGYSVEMAETAALGLKFVNSHPPDVIILDLGLPDMDGKDFVKKVREWSMVPIIILSARDAEDEKIAALEEGADDYLTKPFGTGELSARIKVALRHRMSDGNNIKSYKRAGLEIDLEKRLVLLNSDEIRLTPTEYKMLECLAINAGKVVTQAQLINHVWGKNNQGNSHYLRIYVQRLREKLNDDPLKPEFITTDAGIGYRLNEADKH